MIKTVFDKSCIFLKGLCAIMVYVTGDLHGDLNRLDVPFRKLTEVTAITSEGVRAVETKKDGSNEELFYPCDCVVVASGVHPDPGLYETLTAAGIPARCVGNAAHARADFFDRGRNVFYHGRRRKPRH